MLKPLKSFIPTADELLSLDLLRLGQILLLHLKSYEGLNTVYQHAGLNRGYFRAMLENRNVGLGSLPPAPEYGARQPAVTKRMMEAWNWLERQGLLIHNDQQPADWFFISSEGERFLRDAVRFEQWEELGVERVKSDLLTGGTRVVGGTLETQDLAWKWVQMKEAQATSIAREQAAASRLTIIADTRIAELQALTAPDFDFKKLIRLCEEINTAYSEGCYFATAMLTRGLLDHVPPVFGLKTFSEVANNYAGGGKSFKDTMHHLENASRKVADAHLHMPIRKSETLPTAQQVNCGQQLDMLLSEIVRITK
jgi:hypothetical protein